MTDSEWNQVALYFSKFGPKKVPGTKEGIVRLLHDAAEFVFHLGGYTHLAKILREAAAIVKAHQTDHQ